MEPWTMEQPVTPPWRVVLLTDFGEQTVALMRQILAAHEHKLVGILTSPGPKGRGLDRYVDVVKAAPRGVDVIVSNYPRRWAAMLAPMRPDLIVSAAFPWIIPDDVIALPRLGTINMHGGLLPEQRGPNSYGWAMRKGDAEVGFTIHRVDSGLDTGPILARVAEPAGDEYADVTFRKLLPRMPELWGKALARVAAGDPGDPQDESRAFYAGIFEEAYRTIDWTQPAREIHNQCRAWMAGLRGTIPGAVGIVDGQLIRVLRTRVATGATGVAAPGDVISRSDETLTIQTGDGAIEVLSFQPAEVEPHATASLNPPNLVRQ
jgi:methionyl-tRNA formyltransferase